MKSESIFELWVIMDENLLGKPHYPQYDVEWVKLASASTPEKAQEAMKEHIRINADWWPKSIRNHIRHHYSIRQAPLDGLSYNQSLSERIYDNDGNQIDERTFSTWCGKYETFNGRSPEQIRFKEGDIVEALEDGKIQLGFVVGLPTSVKEAEKINNSHTPFGLDASDDSYTVLFDSSYDSHSHVDALCVFKPQHKIHPGIEQRLRKAYNDFRTFPARQEIANATAEARLKDILEELDIEGKIVVPQYGGDDFILILTLNGASRAVLIKDKKAYDHLDRVRITLFRLAGKPIRGRGYGIRKNDNNGLEFR